jgi:hypothetical protein
MVVRFSGGKFKNIKRKFEMKKIILCIGLLSVIMNLAVAQHEPDALRYSQIYLSGTSRSAAMGGAFGSLGADMSSLSSNPAGISFYKGGDVSFSPSFFYQQTNSSYNNNLSSDAKFTMNFNSLGLVISSKKDRGLLLNSMTFGIAYNRTNNFNNAFRIESKNNSSSILDVYVNEANGTYASNIITTYPFSSGLAFDLYLLDTIVGDTTNYFSVVPNGGTTQRKYVETTGGSGELAMTFGLRVGERLHLGATLGFPTVRYIENSTYEEVDEQDSISTLDHFEVYDHLSTTGSGINFKFGAILRVTDFVRIGAAFHSPSVIQLTDSYHTTISRTWDDGTSADISTLDFYPEGGLYSYTLTTPMRLTAGVAFIIAKRAAISADYEFVDYSTARLSSSDYAFFDENNSVTSSYKPTSNIKVGAEWKLNPIALRAGYAFYDSPYNTELDLDGSRSVYSVGFGFREKKYYFDITYALSQKLETYYMYDPAFADAAATNLSTSHALMATLGFRF